MKRITLILAVMMLACALAFSACDVNTPPPPDTSDTGFNGFGDVTMAPEGTPNGSGDTTVNTDMLPESNGSQGLGLNSLGDGTCYVWELGACLDLDVVIPESEEGIVVTGIGSYAFRYEEHLTSVTIPDSVTWIGDGAFEDCYGLTSVSIGSGVTSIGVGAFDGCYNLASITLGENNTAYFVQDGILYAQADYSIVVIPKTISGDITLADGVTIIGDDVFKGCANLSSVTFPDSVTEIGTSVFKNCTALTSVTIPAGVTSIGYFVFSDCDALTDIYFAGSEAEWAAIDSHTDIPSGVTVHYGR